MDEDVEEVHGLRHLGPELLGTTGILPRTSRHFESLFWSVGHMIVM